MKSFIIKANKYNRQLINCSFIDKLVENFPVSVLFFFRKKVDSQELIKSLEKVLSDFTFFAGRLKKIKENLYIDCNNQGVSFSITEENYTIDHILSQLININKKKLVNIINPQDVISNQTPIMTVKLTYFSCGGMVLGVCWHHSIGDMNTFMLLMKAWSNNFNKQEYCLPLIIQEREQYLKKQIPKNENTLSSIKYMSILDILKFALYVLFSASNKVPLMLFFSENELNNMKNHFLEKTSNKLSTNDILSAHLFKIIQNLETSNKRKTLSIVVDFRKRANLPDNLVGNMIDFLNILTNIKAETLKLAQDIRQGVNNFGSKYLSFFASNTYLEQNGGIKEINRFIIKSIEPINKTLVISNWSNFGVYDITFGDSKPFYFTPWGTTLIPWLSVISNGFSNKGLIYSAVLPSKLVKEIVKNNNLQNIHKYRAEGEILPELVTKLKWLQ